MKEAEMGESIYNFIFRVKNEMELGRDEESCKFNDQEFYIRRHSHEYDICEKYQMLCKIARLERER